MVSGPDGWAAVRAVTGIISLAKSLWPHRSAKPKPRERAYVDRGNALLEIENQGSTGEFRAQIVKAVNVEGWPSKPVWARWHSDKDAKAIKIPSKTRASIRVGTWLVRPDGNKWKCHWGSDFAMGQFSLARTANPQNVAEIHVQIVTDPERQRIARRHRCFGSQAHARGETVGHSDSENRPHYRQSIAVHQLGGLREGQALRPQ